MASTGIVFRFGAMLTLAATLVGCTGGGGGAGDPTLLNPETPPGAAAPGGVLDPGAGGPGNAVPTGGQASEDQSPGPTETGPGGAANP